MDSTLDAIQRRECDLEQRKTVLAQRVAEMLERAKMAVQAKKKSEALLCLRRKALLESDMAKLNSSILRIAEQRATLEDQYAALTVVSTTRAVASAAKENMKQLQRAGAEELLDGLGGDDAGTVFHLQQYQAALAAPTGHAADLDDEQLLGELDEMEAAAVTDHARRPAMTSSSSVHKVPAPKFSSMQPTMETPKLSSLQPTMEREEIQQHAPKLSSMQPTMDREEVHREAEEECGGVEMQAC